MAFEPGHQEVGGRKKGTKNKKTESLQQQLDNKNFNILDQLIDILPALSPDRRAQVLLQLLSYQYPKRKPIEDMETKNSESTLNIIYLDEQDRNA